MGKEMSVPGCHGNGHNLDGAFAVNAFPLPWQPLWCHAPNMHSWHSDHALFCRLRSPTVFLTQLLPTMPGNPPKKTKGGAAGTILNVPVALPWRVATASTR